MLRLFVIVLISLVLRGFSIAQTKEYTSLSTLFRDAIRNGDEQIQYVATLPLVKPESLSPESLTSAYPELRSYWQDTFFVFPLNLSLTIQTDNPEYRLELRDMHFRNLDLRVVNTKPFLKILGDTVGLVLKRCKFDTLEIAESNTTEVGITGCKMNKLALLENKVKESYWLHDSWIGILQTFGNRGRYIDVVKVRSYYTFFDDDEVDWMNIVRSEFCMQLPEKMMADSLTIVDVFSIKKFKLINDSSTFYRDAFSMDHSFYLSTKGTAAVNIRSSVFHTHDLHPSNRIHLGNCESLDVRETKFQSPLYIFGNVTSLLVLQNNRFEQGINFLALSIPETPVNRVSLTWPDFKGHLWIFFGPNWAPYYGETDQELASITHFNNLIQSYYKLYSAFRTQGEIDNANDCYITLKELHERRLSYLWRTEGGFTNFFRLRLSQLLGIYTRHGTDPAQAIVGSIWVVLAFAIFYFFYPSDWDKESKKEMIDRFRTFVEKNEHGYIKPFFHLLGGFSLSLVNALTLSLNVFVTLGFGSIPTSGLARYVCIIQGCIGWFLLSIFTVALINQVLF